MDSMFRLVSGYRKRFVRKRRERESRNKKKKERIGEKHRSRKSILLPSIFLDVSTKKISFSDNR